MAIWVRLKNIQYIEQNGVNVTKYPGDWVRVNKRLASLWISQGEAEIPGDGEMGELYKGEAGCVVCGDLQAAMGILGPYQQDIDIRLHDRPELLFERSVLWDTSLPIRRQLLPIGLMLLDKWEMCAPLHDYDQLALCFGTQEDQEQAQAVIRDLRVPVYESRFIFARDTEPSRQVMGIWEHYQDEGIDRDLAFLMAVYKIKPVILALPTTWIDNNARI